MNPHPARPLRVGVVMDPIARINPKKDSTLAMLLAAQARGWDLHTLELGDLWLRDGEAWGRARPVTVRADLHDWYTHGEAVACPLGDFDVLLMRKDPPFDTEYIYATYILGRAEAAGCLVVNRPQGLRDMNEKVFTAWFPQCCAPTLITRNMADMRARPDLIHLHVAYPAGAAARRLAAYWGVPLVLTEHWTVYGRTAWADCPAWRRWDMRRTGAAADCICPVTRGLGEDMQAAGVGRNGLFVPVPNVVDTGLFHPQEPGAAEEPLTLLHISSLVDHHKNISGLLRALAMCLPELPGLRVRIIGDGDPEPHRRFAEALGIGDRIHWGTEIPLAQVAAEMRQAHALVLFSHFENFPCVIGEAWASGIPVFATRVGGIAEYLDAAHGALVEPGDEAGLARVLRDWVNGRRWDPVRLRSTATDRFSLPAVAEAYDRVYRTLLDPAEGSHPVNR